MKMTMQEKLLKTQRTNAWKNNSKHIEALGFELPDDLLVKIKEQTKNVSKMVICSYDRFCDLFPAVTMPEFSAVGIAGDPPVMYLYFPGGTEKVAQVQKEKRQKFTNMKQKCSMFRKLYGSEATDALQSFIYSLPASVPYKTRFCGSREYMEKLASDDAITYGSVKDNVFAVEHTVKGEAMVTIFVSELTEEIINQSRERHYRQKMLDNIVEKLHDVYQIEASDELKKFVMNLPTDIPTKFHFDGSRIRVIGLCSKEDAVLHGAMSDNCFAVSHNIKGTPTITFFIKEIDYVGELAKKLVKLLQIDEGTASFISQALEHDRYYGGFERFNDFEGYFNEVADRLHVKPGRTIHDICQGDVIISNKKEENGINTKLPSAVLSGYNLIVYYPA